MEQVKSLKEQCYFLRKSNIERKDYMNDIFKPQFIRYIGVFDDYESSLKTLKIMSIEDKNKWLFFENEIPLDQDLEFFEKIRGKVEELKGINLANSDLIIFGDSEVNEVFLKSVDYIGQLLTDVEDMKENIYYEFLANLICMSKQYLSRKKFDYVTNIKCVYFGKIDKVGIYFLILLYRMMVDVIYINPSDINEKEFEKADDDMLSTLVKSDKIIQNIEKFSLDYIAKKGIELRKIKSTASYIQKNVFDNLYSNKEMYYTNQFLNYNIVPMVFDGVVADLYHTLVSDVRLREGFKVNEETKTLYLPHYFVEIQGVNEDIEEYKKLVNHLLGMKNTICITKETIREEINQEKYNIMNELYYYPDKVHYYRNFFLSELAYTRNEDDTFNLEDIKKVSFYNKFRKLKDTTTNHIFGKINEIVQTPFIFTERPKFREKVALLFSTFLIDDVVYEMLENYDFTNNAPKIILFLGENELISSMATYILTILSMLGLDIIVLSPSGKSGIDKYINENVYSQIILEKTKKISLEETLTESKDKEGFFSVLLKWKK